MGNVGLSWLRYLWQLLWSEEKTLLLCYCLESAINVTAKARMLSLTWDCCSIITETFTWRQPLGIAEYNKPCTVLFYRSLTNLGCSVMKSLVGYDKANQSLSSGLGRKFYNITLRCVWINSYIAFFLFAKMCRRLCLLYLFNSGIGWLIGNLEEAADCSNKVMTLLF